MQYAFFWMYAFNVIVNSFLTFLTLVFLFQALFFLFRFKAKRAKAVIFLLPLLKLLIDPFFYDFGNSALLHQINPLTAEVGSRALSILFTFPSFSKCFFPLFLGIQFSIYEKFSFSPADLFLLFLNPSLVKAVVSITLFISFFLFCRLIYWGFKSYQFLIQIKKNSSLCKKRVKNPFLLKKLGQTNTLIILSDHLMVPCTFGFFQKWICFPSQLMDKLSQEEFEAVTAHELGHILWHDSLVRILLNVIQALFWWIPVYPWVRHIESLQEEACDEKIETFKVSKLTLASALLKTAKETKKLESLLFCFFKQNKLKKRLQILLDETNRKTFQLFWFKILFVSTLSFSLFWGKFWIP